MKVDEKKITTTCLPQGSPTSQWVLEMLPRFSWGWFACLLRTGRPSRFWKESNQKHWNAFGPFFPFNWNTIGPFFPFVKNDTGPFSPFIRNAIHFLPNIEDHSFTCCCFTQIQPSFLVNRPRVFWEWDKVVVKMSNIGSLWVIRYAWQLLSNENFDTDISWKQLVDHCEQVIRSSMGVQRGGLGPTARRSHGGGGLVGGGGRPIGLESSNCPEAASPACVLNIINLLKWSTTDKGEQHIFDKRLHVDSFGGRLPRLLGLGGAVRPRAD